MVKEIFLTGMIYYSPTPTVELQSAECLALNMYYEARNQGSAGLFAVTAVILNRVKDPKFPNTICEVVYQGPTRESWKTRQTKNPNDAKVYPIRNRCQFSWYCDGKSDRPKQKKIYKKLLAIAESIVHNKLPFIDITDGAVFYHADYVKPAWAKTKIKTIEIQDHIFYRWKNKNETR